MGANNSKPTVERAPRYRQVSPGIVSEKATDELVDQLTQYLRVDGGASSVSGDANPISLASLEAWETKLFADPKNRLAQAAVTASSVKELIHPRKIVIEDAVRIFSDSVDVPGAPITNQRQSGRCWIFASLNLLRSGVQKRYNIPELELSQAYVFFYDKLEKANHFLHVIIETAELDLDDKLVETLFNDPISDGGQWDMLVNIVEKYGVVPQNVFPDASNAQNSSTLDYILVSKLKEYALLLRKAKTKEQVSTASLYTLKEKFVQELYGVLAISLGTPPKADDSFVWEYVDGDGKPHAVTTTPRGFYRDIVKVDTPSYFSLIHDPRNEYNKLYVIDHLNNSVGGKPVEYVNAPIEAIKDAAIRSIQNNEPVFFGSDVGKFSDTPTGVLDPRNWDYELAFNVKFNLNKADRITTGLSAPNHAMMLTAVNLVDGKPTKWKVMNSWGPDVGDKGYFVMSDEWFDEYVLQIVTHANYADKSLTEVWKKKEYTTLPLWDPFGTLAN